MLGVGGMGVLVQFIIVRGDTEMWFDEGKTEMVEQLMVENRLGPGGT